MKSLKDRFEELARLREESKDGGGKERVKKLQSLGRLSARERIDELLDPHTFLEIDPFVVHRQQRFGMDQSVYRGDGVISGFGKICGKRVAIFSQDFSCWGGALGAEHAKKICKIMDSAYERRIPIIGINDSGGARIQEGVEALGGYADIFHRNVKCSGVVPQISLVMGPCAGGAVYSPAITDFVFMVEKLSYMFVTGPDVIRTVTHEEVTKEELGGARAHSEKSGVCHFRSESERECFSQVRELMYFIPQAFDRPNSRKETADPDDRENAKLDSFIPASSKRPYDMGELICEVVDDGHFFEVHREFAQNIIVGFASLGGIKIGLVANQPSVLAGVLDIDSSEKASRFVRFCDAMGIPLLTLIDVPGFLPGLNQEHAGIIRRGAKLLYAFSEATVPMVSLITRKAYGGAYDVMASKHIGADFNFAYPTGEIAVMGAEGAVNIIFRKELSKLSGEKLEARRAELVGNYESEFASPYKASELAYIDNVIYPRETRKVLIRAFHELSTKTYPRTPRKHGNIPL